MTTTNPEALRPYGRSEQNFAGSVSCITTTVRIMHAGNDRSYIRVLAMSLIKKTDSIFVSGHLGMVGSALIRRLVKSGYTNIQTASRSQLDLKSQEAVLAWFNKNQPDHVILAAGKVGGIDANRLQGHLGQIISMGVIDRPRRQSYPCL